MDVLETDRLIIQPFDVVHVHDFLEFYNQAETMKWVGNGKSTWTENELLEKMARFSGQYPFGIYSVFLKSECKVIGEISLFDTFQSSVKAEIGYIIHQGYWNKGYASELLHTFVPFCKEGWKFEQIIARMYSDNIVSAKICEKMGMSPVARDEIADGVVRLTYELKFNH
ncbi:MAG: GNAT family N-acetyltransferase [Bacteroidales bacterium]|jgi:ribosomal-protein-alanine N-acetyltransferase|nr:GNAT family N-acetyltransferase [Bacteroidales bacterium]